MRPRRRLDGVVQQDEIRKLLHPPRNKPFPSVPSSEPLGGAPDSNSIICRHAKRIRAEWLDSEGSEGAERRSLGTDRTLEQLDKKG